MKTTINIIVFGIENTGSQLINHIIAKQTDFNTQSLDLNIPVITNQTVAFFEKDGAKNAWEANFLQFAIPFNVTDIIHYVKNLNLQNLIAVDTSDQYEIIAEYPLLLQNQFDVVCANPNFQSEPLKNNFKIQTFFQSDNQKFVEVLPKKNQDFTQNIFQNIIRLAHQKVTTEVNIF